MLRNLKRMSTKVTRENKDICIKLSRNYKTLFIIIKLLKFLEFKKRIV